MPEAQEPKDYPPRTNALSTLMDKVYFHRLPSYANKIFYGLGFLALTCLVLLAASGILMAFMGQAWWLHNPWGVYVRSVHLWTVQAFIAILILHMLVAFTTSAFKPPRRMVWVFGATILCLAFITTEFGYGLRGDFSSQFRAVSGADFWNGSFLGWWINPLSSLQDFAIHTMIIPFIILALFVLHYLLERTYGISKPYRSDIKYKMVAANHTVMYVRGIVLVAAIAVLAFFFHSPYVPAVTIEGVATQQPALVEQTLTDEYNRTSDTATYLDSIDPYTFDTRQVYILEPYQQLAASSFATSSTSTPDLATMIAAIMPATRSGLYQSLLDSEDPAPETYTLRFLNDMDVLEAKAGTLGFDTEQSGMAKDENGHLLGLPPGSWWLTPLAVLNSTFNLPANPNGDFIAAETLGFIMLIFIAFPYIPYLNRLPELLHLAPFIWKEPRSKEKHEPGEGCNSKAISYIS